MADRRATGHPAPATIIARPALVAQGIEHRPPEPGAEVRILPGAPGKTGSDQGKCPGRRVEPPATDRRSWRLFAVEIGRRLGGEPVNGIATGPRHTASSADLHLRLIRPPLLLEAQTTLDSVSWSSARSLANSGLCALLLAGVAGCGGNAHGWARYHDRFGVSLTKPNSWTVGRSPQSGSLVVYIDPPGVLSRRNILVEEQHKPYAVTFDQFTDETMGGYSQIPNFEEVTAHSVTLSGKPGMLEIWHGDLPGKGTFEFAQKWTVINGKAWVATYTSDPPRFASALPQAERLINSLRLPG